MRLPSFKDLHRSEVVCLIFFKSCEPMSWMRICFADPVVSITTSSSLTFNNVPAGTSSAGERAGVGDLLDLERLFRDLGGEVVKLEHGEGDLEIEDLLLLFLLFLPLLGELLLLDLPLSLFPPVSLPSIASSAPAGSANGCAATLADGGTALAAASALLSMCLALEPRALAYASGDNCFRFGSSTELVTAIGELAFAGAAAEAAFMQLPTFSFVL